MSNARKLADNLPTDGQLSGRNMVINGSQFISQRGTTFTSVASGTFLTDRIDYEKNTTNFVMTASQADDGPAGVSAKSLKVQVTTVGASTPANSTFNQLLYKWEAQDIAHVGLGTSTCQPMVFSFYAKASTTGTLPFALTNNGGTRTFAGTFNITSANTWQRYIFKMPPVTDGTWAGGVNPGLELRIGLEYGSDYTGATTNQWSSISSFANFQPTYTNALASTLNATLNLTGFQLELGSQSTPFEHEPVGVTLSKCQRYFYQFESRAFDMFFDSKVVDATSEYKQGGISFPVEMRSTPASTGNGTALTTANLESPPPTSMVALSRNHASFRARSAATGRMYLFTNVGYKNNFDSEL